MFRPNGAMLAESFAQRSLHSMKLGGRRLWRMQVPPRT
jgi:hypothetical protein